jgi:hypothetical protein
MKKALFESDVGKSTSEEGLPETPIELTNWEGKLRAEYRQEKLAEYK